VVIRITDVRNVYSVYKGFPRTFRGEEATTYSLKAIPEALGLKSGLRLETSGPPGLGPGRAWAQMGAIRYLYRGPVG